MISMIERPINSLRSSAVALLCCALPLAAACFEPKQDDFKSEGGISPDPTGIIAGSVLYVGPRPTCDFEDGRPTKVRGRVVLTLFAYDNPPPPEGRATTALNLMFVNPEELFRLADCRPQSEAVDPSDTITRSVSFSWPQIALGTTQPVSYQVRGFYDSDEDMNPFFSVKNLPTAGDVIGGAVVDPEDISKGLLRITLPTAEDAPNGYKRDGVIVALGNYVWMERGAFELNADNRFLDSAARVRVSQTGTGEIDVTATVNEAWLQTCGRRGVDDCGLTLEQLDEAETKDAFTAGDVQLDFDPEVYAFVSEPVDIVTIKVGGPDVPKADGVPDPHPLMGSNLGVPWFTPIVIMTRLAPTSLMQDIETRAGIPNVRLIGSVLLDDTAQKAQKRVRLDDIEVAVPSIAAVELDPNDTSCRVPYLAPGNYTRAFESRLTYCSELPTGVYGTSAIQGVGGGTRVEEPDTDISENGYVVNGARLSGQAWTLPNDLAVPEQVGEGKTLASQGKGQLFVVHDPKPDQTDDCRVAPDPDQNLDLRPVNYKGICESGQSQTIENPAGTVGAGIDGQNCLPEACCEGVKHLCGLDVCELCDDESCPDLGLGGRNIRRGPTLIVGTADNGKGIPNCVPFEIPALCCD